MHFLKQPNPEKLVRQVHDRKISRREFNATAAAAGVAFLTLPTGQAHATADQMINYFTWSGYEVPELHQSFIDKHGRSPDYSVFASAEDGLQKIRAGYAPDLAHPCIDNVRKWFDSGILAPIDTSRLTHWNDVFTSLQTMEGAEIDGELYMAITDFGLSSIIYRTDIYEGEETWNMLFDEEYAGRICPRGTYVNLTIALKILGEDMFSPSDAALEKAAEMTRKQRPLARFFWESQTDMEQSIATGECVMAYAWNEALVNLREQGIPVAYANPKEGAFGWACGPVRINSGTGDENMQYDFIDAWLAPEAGKFLIEAYGYGHGNQKSFDLVAPETLEALGYTDPIALMANTTFFLTMDPVSDQKMLRLWEEIAAGM
jgi:spermidine/putrescine transport system substrate-binding protein